MVSTNEVNSLFFQLYYPTRMSGGDYYTVMQILAEVCLRIDYHSIMDIDCIIDLINGVY